MVTMAAVRRRLESPADRRSATRDASSSNGAFLPRGASGRNAVYPCLPRGWVALHCACHGCSGQPSVIQRGVNRSDYLIRVCNLHEVCVAFEGWSLVAAP